MNADDWKGLQAALTIMETGDETSRMIAQIAFSGQRAVRYGRLAIIGHDLASDLRAGRDPVEALAAYDAKLGEQGG